MKAKRFSYKDSFESLYLRESQVQDFRYDVTSEDVIRYSELATKIANKVYRRSKAVLNSIGMYGDDIRSVASVGVFFFLSQYDIKDEAIKVKILTSNLYQRLYLLVYKAGLKSQSIPDSVSKDGDAADQMGDSFTTYDSPEEILSTKQTVKLLYARAIGAVSANQDLMAGKVPSMELYVALMNKYQQSPDFSYKEARRVIQRFFDKEQR